MKHLEAIINSGLFNELNKNDYILAFESLQINSKCFNRGEIVFLENDLVKDLCIVEAGSVRGEKTYFNGNVQLADIYDEGSMFAIEYLLSRKKNSDIDYVANENSSVVFISLDSILASPFRNELMTILVHTLALGNIKMGRKLDILAEKSLRNRILMYLGLMSERRGNKEFDIRMTQEQFAQFLCVNRSALSNELSKMKKDGIIDFKKDHFALK